MVETDFGEMIPAQTPVDPTPFELDKGKQLVALDAEYDRLQKAYDAKLPEWNKERDAGRPMIGGMYGSPVHDMVSTPKEQKDWESALTELRIARNKLHSYTNDELEQDRKTGTQKSRTRQFIEGFTSPDVTDVMTFGWDETGRKLRQATAIKKLNRGEKLTPGEEALVTAFRAGQAADQYLASKGGNTSWAGVGESVSASIPFMIQMGLTGGTGGIVKFGANAAVKKGVTGALKRGALKTAEMAANSALQTPLTSSPYTNYAERTLEQYDVDLNDKGQLTATLARPTSEAQRLWQGFATGFSDVFSERLGNVLPTGQAIGNFIKRFAPKALGKSIGGALAKGVDALGNPTVQQMNKWLRKVPGYNGTAGEFAEELANNVIEPVLTGEVERIPENFSSENLWQTAMSVAIMGGMMETARIPAMVMDARHRAQIRKEAQTRLNTIENPTVKQALTEAMAVSGNEERAKRLSAIDWNGVTTPEAAAAMDYVELRTYGDLSGGIAEAMEQQEHARQSKLLFDAFANKDTGSLERVVDTDGNGYFLAGGSLEETGADGVVFVRDPQTGEVSQRNVNDLKRDRSQTYEEYERLFQLDIEAQAEAKAAEEEMQAIREEAEATGIDPTPAIATYKGINLDNLAGQTVAMVDGTQAYVSRVYNEDRKLRIDALPLDNSGNIQVDANGDEVHIDLDVNNIASSQSDIGYSEPVNEQNLTEQNSPLSSVETVDTAQAEAHDKTTSQEDTLASQQNTTAIDQDIPRKEDGSPDYAAMEPVSIFEAIATEFGEDVAREEITNQVKIYKNKIAKLRKNPSEDLGKRLANRKAIADLQNRINGLREAIGLAGESDVESTTETTDTPKATLRQQSRDLGDYLSLEDKILRDIAEGQRFRWTDNGSQRGLATELGFTDSPGERKARFNILANNGITVDQYAERLEHDMDNGVIPSAWDTDVRSSILDVLSRVRSNREALDAAIALRESDPRATMTNEEAQAQAEYDQARRRMNEDVAEDLAESDTGMGDLVTADMHKRAPGVITVREQSDSNANNNFIQHYDIDGRPSGVYGIYDIEAGPNTEPVSFGLDEFSFRSKNWDELESLYNEHKASHPDIRSWIDSESGAQFRDINDALDFKQFVDANRIDPVRDATTPAEKHLAVSELVDKLDQQAGMHTYVFNDTAELPQGLSEQLEPGDEIDGITWLRESYICAPKMQNAEQARRTYIHEVAGHQNVEYAIRKIADRTALWEAVVDDIGIETLRLWGFSELNIEIEKYENGESTKRQVGREAIAYATELNADVPYFTREKPLSLTIDLNQRITPKTIREILNVANRYDNTRPEIAIANPGREGLLQNVAGTARSSGGGIRTGDTARGENPGSDLSRNESTDPRGKDATGSGVETGEADNPGAISEQVDTGSDRTEQGAVPAGETVTEDLEGEDLRYRSAYHGSPHDFDRFDHAFMGTGEGAQAFGWGTYVTEVNGIAKSYATQLTPRVILYDRESLADVLDNEYYFDDAWRIWKKDILSAADTDELKKKIHGVYIDGRIAGPRSKRRKEFERQKRELLDDIDNGRITIKSDPRNLYTVEIPDNTGDNYLKWSDDLPEAERMRIVSSLSEIDDDAFDYDYFLDKLEQYEDTHNLTGEGLYKLLSKYGFDQNDQKASKALSQIGFAGIEYPAQHTIGGRADGAKNYVIFNDQDVQITDHIRFRNMAEANAAHLSPDEVNVRFNSELQQQIDETLPKGHIYQLGMPSAALKAAGVPDLPIELSADRLSEKASTEYASGHPFELSEIENLPQALATPIAVFDSRKGEHSKVALTELESKGNNFVAILRVQKKGPGWTEVEINDVRSLYPKDRVGGIIDWINNGLLRWVDKEKAARFLLVQGPNYLGNGANLSGHTVDETTQQRSNSVEVDIPIKGIDSATNIIKNFTNPTLLDGEKVATADALATELNVPVRVINNATEIPDSETDARRKRQNAGWHSRATGEIAVVLPNCADIAEVQKTILHEAVGHYGIPQLLGQERADQLYRQVFDALDKDVQESLLKKYGSETIAGDEYLAEMAEGKVIPSVFRRMMAAVRSFFRDVLGIDLKLSDADMRYILWRSKNNLQNAKTVSEAMDVIEQDIKMRDQINNPGSPRRDLPKDEPKSVIHYLNSIEPPAEDLRFRKKQKPKPGDSVVTTKDNFMSTWGRRLQDALIPVRQLQDFISKHGGSVGIESDLYSAMNRAPGRATERIKRIDTQKFVPLGGIVREISKQLNKQFDSDGDQISDYKQISDYIAAKSAQERHQSGITAYSEDLSNPWNKEYVENLIQVFEETVEVSLVDKLWSQIRDITNQQLDMSKNYGLITTQTYRDIKARGWQYYVPLQGIDADFEGLTDPHDTFGDILAGKKGSGESELFHKAKGRITKPEDVLGTLQRNVHRTILAGERNAARQFLLRLVDANPELQGDPRDGKHIFRIESRWFVRNPNDGLFDETETRPSDEAIAASNDARQRKKKLESELRSLKLSKDQSIPENDRLAEYLDKRKDLIDRIEAESQNITVTTRPMEAGAYRGLTKAEEQTHTVTVRKNGVRYVVRFSDPAVANAINNNFEEFIGGIAGKAVDFLGKGTRVLASLSTSWNPEFIIPNNLRDAIWAGVYNAVDVDGNFKGYIRNIPNSYASISRDHTGHSTPLTLNERAQYDIYTPQGSRMAQQEFGMQRVMDSYYDDFLMEGGLTGYAYMHDVKDYSKKLARKIKANATVGGEVLGILNDAAEFMGDMSEISTRFATFLSQVQMGRDVREAVNYAKNITINFNTRGEWGRGMNSLFMFYNASMQGVANVYRLTKRNPGRMSVAIATMMGLGYGMSLLLSQFLAAGGDDGEEWNISDYERYTNFILPGSWFGSKDGYLKIPIPMELRPFWISGVVTNDMNQGKIKAEEAWKTVLQASSDAFSPLEMSTDHPVKTITPTLFKPVAEVLWWKTDFAGRQINRTPFTKAQEGLIPDSQLGQRNANIISKSVTKWMNELGGGNEWTPAGTRKDGSVNPWLNALDISPSTLDHLAASYTGGIGRMLLRTFNFVTQSGDERSARNWPVFNRFYGEVRKEVNPNTRYYDIRAKYQSRHDLFRNNAKNGAYPSYYSSEQEAKVDYANIEAVLNKMKPYDKALSRMKRMLGGVEYGSDEYKRITKTMNRVKSDFIKEYHHAFED